MQIKILLFSVHVIAAAMPLAAGAQTRALEDRANAKRSCTVPPDGAGGEQRAVRCAESFVARQGYSITSATVDTTSIVPEGIVSTASIREELRARRGSLRSNAVGVCANNDGTYLVVFSSAIGDSMRGVTMAADFNSLRMQHSDFIAANLQTRQRGCHSIVRTGTK